jgi:CubicO group peptidase (beta-lactamase class C family)
MNDTSFQPTAEQQKRLVTLYKPGKEKGTIEPAAHWINDLSQDRPPNPSGGLFSTAANMAKFYQMVLDGGKAGGKQIVSRQTVKTMATCQTGDLKTGFTPGNCWGLGWCVIQEPQGVTQSLSPGTFGHGGAFGTQGWVDPQRRMIFVLMIQRTGFGNADGSDIRGAFHKLAVEALGE